MSLIHSVAMKTQEPLRLVKLLLAAELVRDVDRAILAAGGAYQDRSEFIAEAIRDRLTEEEAIRRTPDGLVAREAHAAELTLPFNLGGSEAMSDLGRWRSGKPTVVPASVSTGVNFGLHNRDLPSLWALDLLANMAVESGSAPGWDQFIDRVRAHSLGLGERLRMQDLSGPTATPAAIGFPKAGPKVVASLDRFVAATIGSPRRADGPFFVLGLAALVGDEGERLSPTDAALTGLANLIDAGLGTRLPQPAKATIHWWSFLADTAPAEKDAWHKVLAVIAESPDRDGLMSRFPEWPGQLASTNTSGFISRSREWGLLQPKLVDGRYQLTELGSALAQEG